MAVTLYALCSCCSLHWSSASGRASGSSATTCTSRRPACHGSLEWNKSGNSTWDLQTWNPSNRDRPAWSNANCVIASCNTCNCNRQAWNNPNRVVQPWNNSNGDLQAWNNPRFASLQFQHLHSRCASLEHLQLRFGQVEQLPFCKPGTIALVICQPVGSVPLCASLN